MLQIEIIGNLGSDAEIKQLNGKNYVSFNVAHSEKRKDANGITVDSTTWVSVLLHGDGGNLLQYLKKGCKVFVRGRMYVKTYVDKSGQTQAAINVNASEINLCGLKGESNSQQDNTRPITDDDIPF